MNKCKYRPCVSDITEAGGEQISKFDFGDAYVHNNTCLKDAFKQWAYY